MKLTCAFVFDESIGDLTLTSYFSAECRKCRACHHRRRHNHEDFEASVQDKHPNCRKCGHKPNVGGGEKLR